MSEMALKLIALAKAEGWKTLDLGRCGIVGAVPEEIGELEQLEDLILSDTWWDWEASETKRSRNRGAKNHLRSLPLRLPKGIRYLVLSNTFISDVGPVGHLDGLKRLILDSSPLIDLSPIERIISLVSLSISSSKIIDFAPLSALKNLQRLSLYATSITDLSPIASLIDLRRLSLGRTIPKDLYPLTPLKKLERLYLDYSGIEDLEPIKELENLQRLYMDYSKVTEISALSNLSNLKRVSLMATKVENLSPLKEIMTKGIDVKVSEYDGSDGIFVKGCKLSNPPIEIASQGNAAILQFWEDLEVGRKFDVFINRDVRLILLGNSNAGKSTLANYLIAGKLTNTRHSTHGMKTMVWLPEFKIDRLKSSQNLEGKCRVRILDFGGQEYYHDTHHLFFNDNTAYLVIWDEKGNTLREFEGDSNFSKDKRKPKVKYQNYPLQYWLDAIKFHKSSPDYDSMRNAEAFEEEDLDDAEEELPDYTIEEDFDYGSITEYDIEDFLISMQQWNEVSFPSAPALIVQNKTDRDGIQFLPQNLLKIRFDFIYDFTSISLSKDHPSRLKQIVLSIEELLGKMHIVGSELPIQYAWIIESVEKQKFPKDQLDVSEFLEWSNNEIYKKNNDETLQLDNNGADVLLKYLVNIGLILYYPNHTSLSSVVFLRPDKVLEGIYSIFEGAQPLNGRFDDTFAKRKLKKYQGDSTTLLLLMRQFKIIFLEGGQAGKYVAPLYLNPKPIQGVQLFLDLFRQPTYRVQYEAFIHKSVVLHFFEAFGPRAFREETLGGKELYYYWRDGIVIKDENSDARILVQFFIGEEDEYHPEGIIPAHIDIFLLGTTESSDFLKEVLETLNEINEGWNTTTMVTSNGKDFVPLEIVENAATQKQFTFFHQDKIFQLIDFRKFIKLKMPMKKVFISYSKADLEYLKQLENHLSVFKRNGNIATWNDRKLIPGEKWDGKIKKELEEADIILFLISADFLSTDYIWETEMKKALDRDAKGEAKIVPIVVRPCAWKDTPLGKFYSPEKAKPIAMAENQDEAWRIVVENLEKIMVSDIQGRDI